MKAMCTPSLMIGAIGICSMAHTGPIRTKIISLLIATHLLESEPLDYMPCTHIKMITPTSSASHA
eukprot:scaffold277523_cov18-Tisochrysis_lutea.AAC.1